MFELKTFILNTLRSMFGNEPEYKVRQFGSEWFDKNVLTIENLQEIDLFYNSKKK